MNKDNIREWFETNMTIGEYNRLVHPQNKEISNELKEYLKELMIKSNFNSRCSDVLWSNC